MLEAYLISVVLKSTVLLISGALLLRVLRKKDAGTRHLVCLATLGSAAAVPLLALWSPDWSFNIAVPVGAGVGGSAANGTATQTWSLPIVAAAIWAIGVLGLAIRALGGWLLLLSVRRESVHFQDGDGVEIRIARVTSPLTCGTLRPWILLPPAARNWDQPRLRTVLVHELEHVRRRDCLAKYVALGSRAILWWNPLTWILAARMHQEQERACDEAVLSAGVAPEAYAGVLLDTARECSSSLILGCAMSSTSALRSRVEHLFAWRKEKMSGFRRTAIALPVLLALMTGVSCAEKIYKIGPGILPPKVAAKSDPEYTQEARAAKLQGPVVLSFVVGLDHMAHDIKVTKSLDPGLDASAIASVKKWKFEPGTKNGKPVPVLAHVQVNFKLL